MPYLLQQLLATSASQYPEKAAILYKKQEYSYRELEVVSNQLAHMLRHAGVQTGDRVGIYMNKSIKAAAAIFGILKAGAAYVPLDPSAPAKRVAFIIDNCQMKALISTQEKLDALGVGLSEPLSAIECVVITDDGSSVSDSPVPATDLLPQAQDHTAANPHRAVGGRQVTAEIPLPTLVSWTEVLRAPTSPPPAPALVEDDLAYILYTSGSTGTPKGVMISHRASLTFVNWAYDYFQVQSTDRVSNHAPFHFDLSVFDLFTGIQAGATVVLVPPGLSVFPQSLASFIAKQRITIWYSVPSLLIQLTLRGNLYQHHFASLRAILFAGEVFPIKYLRQLVEQIPHPKYYNLYGPTETNVCTCYAVTETDLAPERVEPLPIGQVCANSEVMVLNEQQQRLQPGEIGELYVRGPSLMKGYLGMPQKSRAVLLPYVLDPALGPETIYRTGDLVKQVADDTYLFLGRCDNMIKSRGYRIELGEIETALYDHPAVEEVAVVAISDDQRTNVIKAVVVIRDDRTLHTRDLEYFCAGRLPAYMIPSIIEIRAKLPKTSTGKVDKTRLHQQMDGLST